MANNFSLNEYKAFQIYLEKTSGIVLGENKHYLVSSRLNSLMQQHQIANLQQLVDKLTSPALSDLKVKVIEAMTTNETLWFRDSYPFKILSENIFTELKNQPSIKIWSAACSSGQEPYSISMIAEEFKQKSPLLRVSITATDISQAILKDAKAAKYESLALARGLSEERKHRYFTQTGKYWQVNIDIRNRIIFRECNLLESYDTLGKFDIIFCRNVLIYFSAQSKTNILNRMAKSLNPNGFLILGASESIVQYSDAFEMLKINGGVIYRLKS